MSSDIHTQIRLRFLNYLSPVLLWPLLLSKCGGSVYVLESASSGLKLKHHHHLLEVYPRQNNFLCLSFLIYKTGIILYLLIGLLWALNEMSRVKLLAEYLAQRRCFVYIISWANRNHTRLYIYKIMKPLSFDTFLRWSLLVGKFVKVVSRSENLLK